MRHEDFVLKKNYTIVKRIEHSFGKWPSTYGNSFFLDSKFLLYDILELVKTNIINFLEKNNYGEEDIVTTEEIYLLMNSSVTEQTINDYAIHVNTHLKDRK